MEPMDGIRLMETLHARQPRLPVLIMTAHGTIETAVDAVQRGAFDYLTKPFVRDELRFRQALALYDEFLARYPDDVSAPRALESRDTVAAIVTTRDELSRLRGELRLRESEAAKLRDEVARLRQELSSRQAESDKLRADLEKMKELDLRLERKPR